MPLPSYETMLDRLYSKIPQKQESQAVFEMPKVQSIIQGSRTIVQNFSEISDALARDPEHVLKYLNKELATVGNFDKHRVIFQGKFLANHLNNKLALYAKEFVFCPECGRHDTKLTKEERVPMISCMACGARKPVRVL